MSFWAKALSVCELSIGEMWTSPPPWRSEVRFCVLSQYRRAMSWVLPSCGVAIVFPRRSAAEVMPGRTTRKLPPLAAPATTRIAWPPLLMKVFVAGPGPT